MSKQNSGCIGVILQAIGLIPKDITPIDEVLPYVLRDDFLSPSELSFCKVLKQVVGDQVLICPKVALKDIFFTKTLDRSQRSTYNNKINLKHVDFLLCSVDSLKPICGIELDDSSHKREDRVQRDIFFEKVFQAAGLKLVRFENRRSYTLVEIEKKIKPMLTSHIESLAFETIPRSNGQKIDVNSGPNQEGPMCEKCGVPMILRVTRKGDSKGRSFYGCPNFPKCRKTIQVETM